MIYSYCEKMSKHYYSIYKYEKVTNYQKISKLIVIYYFMYSNTLYFLLNGFIIILLFK